MRIFVCPEAAHADLVCVVTRNFISVTAELSPVVSVSSGEMKRGVSVHFCWCSKDSSSLWAVKLAGLWPRAGVFK